MKRLLTALAATVAILLLAPAASHGQNIGQVKLTVRDDGGTPLQDVNVELTQSFLSVGFATTDANGEAIFTDVAPGFYDIIVQPSFSIDCATCSIFRDKELPDVPLDSLNPGFDSENNLIDLAPVDLDRGDRTVTVTVNDDLGDPVQDIIVSAFSTEDFEGFASGQTNAQGQFAFFAPATGIWIIEASEEDPETALFAPVSVEHNVPESPADTSVTLELGTLDSTITVRLRDGENNPVLVPNGAGPIFIDCFSDNETNPLFFFGELQDAESEKIISVQGNREYECRIFDEGLAASPATVQLGDSDAVNADLIISQADFELTVEFVDGDGNLVEVMGEVFASTFPAEEGEGIEHSAFSDQPVNGQYTLNLISGQLYDVGFFAESGTGSGDGGGGAFQVLAGEDQFLSRESFREVDTSQGTEATVRFLVEQADATINVTVNDSEGNGLPDTWVDLVCEGIGNVGEDDGEEAPTTIRAAEDDGDPFDDTLEDNALFFGALTDSNGEATLLALSGLNCVITAWLSPETSGLNPAPKEFIPEPGVNEITLGAQEADFTLNITLSAPTTLEWAYCAAFGDLAQNFAEVSGTTAELALIAGGSYEVICEGGAGESFYSGRSNVNAAEGSTEAAIELTLAAQGSFYDPQTYNFQASAGTTIMLADQCSRIEIPAGAFGTSGGVTLTAGSNREPVPWSETIEPFGLFEFNAVNDQGQSIRTLQKAISIIFCYQDSDIPDDIEESELSCAGSNEQETTLTTVRSSVDTVANELTCVTDHLSTYGLNVSGGAVESSSLSSPVFTLWNGFLSMTNILEIVNKGASATNVTVTMFDISGVQQSQTAYSVPAQSQLDVIVNSLSGFSADSYGLIKLEYTGTNIDGRVFYYRTVDSFVSYEYAYGVPFSNALQGNSYVAFNTFNPSTSAADAADQVLNWLSIVNLETTEKNFTIRRYALDGSLLKTDTVSVAGSARLDIDAGHGEGPNKVGYSEIAPADTSGNYKAELVRYGARSDGSYAFAFPLIASKASNGQWVSISSGAGAQNWLEVQNITAAAVDVTLTFYDNTGATINTTNVNLAAFSGQHIEASAFLSAGQTGAVNITSTSADPVVAQSMYYFREATGSIQAMYGAQATESLGGTRFGTWNLYLNMFNWLRVFNTSDSTIEARVKIFNGAEVASERVISLAPKTGTDLGLHETASYGTEVDKFGPVSVEGTGLLTELLRFRPDGAGLDFAAPTAVRP